jgi:hypothetical protein
LKRIMTGVGASAVLLGSSLALGIGASPAGAATVRPATATNCTIAGTNYGGADPHYWGWKATCSDGPTNTWQLVVVCESYGGKVVTIYGNVVTGNGTSFASCPGSNYEDDSINVVNLS